jgi:3-hydroxyacyl-[acyl-carrier-protein] dehydratase|tara:strand:+ start:1477 stop:2073 length:597 start_codon:yes stop_codon:yes gene_type:complete
MDGIMTEGTLSTPDAVVDKPVTESAAVNSPAADSVANNGVASNGVAIDSSLTISEIMNILPHRYPFLLVDRVLELVEGERILAIKNVTGNEDVFNGHFPGAPIFPGVMIIEALAQASGILGFKTTNTTADDGKLYLFAGVDKARFKKPVTPGDQLMLESRVVAVKRNIWRFQTRATVNDKLVCEATLLCAYQDRDKVK